MVSLSGGLIASIRRALRLRLFELAPLLNKGQLRVQSVLQDDCGTCIVISICIHGAMIKSFRHKGLQRFFETGARAGIQWTHASRLRLQLAALNQARKPADMGAANWRLHPLKGDLKGHWSVWVSGNWRLTFRFECEDAVLVDYHDYH